ncbi:MAG: DUF4924 family protein [Bacteroidales bacterium]|nr:DUF4924 family protein [Bacteroidales bacterium]
MIISREKRKNNIAEYILYMWQIEDLIRAYNFDIERINSELVSQYDVSDNERTEIFSWYAGLAESMLTEGVRSHGHLQYLDSLVEELNDFHFRLIDSSHHSEYQKKYMTTVRDISELRLKMGSKERISDMEVCLTALYGLILMRIKKRKVSKDTEKVFNSFSELLADLSKTFKSYETGTIEI